MAGGNSATASSGGSPSSTEEAIAAMVFKAHVIGRDVGAATAITSENTDKITAIFKKQGVVTPAFPPQTLMRIYENSSALSQNVAAYQTNIDGLGWRLEPVIDFEQKDARDEVREAIWFERWTKAERLGSDDELHALAQDPTKLMPNDLTVDERIEKLKREARIERFRLEAFLQTVNPDGSFTSLRRETRLHKEITGNAYWEVLRNKRGEIARFVLVPPTHVRLMAQDESPTKTRDRAPLGILGWDVVTQHRFFRRYVQAVGERTIFFKQFGDPRVVSAMTGKVYPDRATFESDRKKPKGDQPASEMIHFKIDHPGEPYGAPRWIGTLLSVLGSRAADEVNYTYFDNKAVPPLALLVTGGRLGDETTKRIESYVRERIKGRRNFHSILVIEATPSEDAPLAAQAPTATIKFERLMDAQSGDALFQKYDERNIDKVGSSFRLPRLMRGDVRDFNRATAMASLRFAETQVFEPERRDFDDWFNRTILPELSVRLWGFRSNANRNRDPEVVTAAAERLTKQGIITPNEARELANDALPMRDLPPREEFWAKQPLQLTLVGIRPDDPSSGPGGGQEPVEPAEGETDPLRTLDNEGRIMGENQKALDDLGIDVEDAVRRLDELASAWLDDDDDTED